MKIKRGGVGHRYLALTMLLLVFYGMLMLIWTLLSLSNESKQRYGDMQLQLQKYQLIAESLPKIKSEHQRLINETNNEQRYLRATEASLAVADLQRRLKGVIQQSGVDLISMQSIYSQVKKDEDFEPVKILLQLRLKNQALVQLLYLLETQKPVGFIYSLRIQPQPQFGGNTQQEGDDLLDIRMEYTAYMVKPNAH